MDHIETAILNCYGIREAEQNMVFAARLTQHGHTIQSISATPYQWKHMIGQRTCRRNTDETRIVMLQIWQRLYKLSPILFAPDLTGPFCQRGSCMEKQMSCQNPISKLWMPSDILKTDYPLLIRKEVSSHKD